MSRQLDIANAVRDAAAAWSFTTSVNPVVRLAPIFDLQRLTNRQVSVIPFGFVSAPEARERSLRAFRVDLVVQKQLTIADGDVDQAEWDVEATLIEELTDFVEHDDNSSLDSMKFVGGDSLELQQSYEGLLEELHRANVFFSSVPAIYQYRHQTN